MSYMKPGFYEVPDGQSVIGACTQITAGGNWIKDLSPTLDKLGRGGRRVMSLSIEDIIALPGEGWFAKGTPPYHCLQRILLRFLHSMKVVERYPAVVGYKNYPQLNMDEVLDRMMTPQVKFPSFDSLGGAAGFNVEALKAVMPTIIRELDFKARLRGIHLKRLRLKLGSIAFKLASGAPIDQAERSFYCGFWDMRAHKKSRALTASEILGGNIAPIAVAETGDPLVGETWELFKLCTEAGPYLRFATMVSNRNFENLVYWYGPQIASLSYAIGYTKGFGKFDEPVVKEAVVLPWGKDDQLVATRERYAAFSLGEANVVSIQPPVLSTVGNQALYEPGWDLPNVSIRVDLAGSSIRPTEFSFYSSWRERTLSSRSGATPRTLLTDLALTTERLGENQSAQLSLHEWPLIDLNASKAFLGGQAPIVPNYVEDIITHEKGPKRLKHEQVDMEDHYKRMGNKMFMPAFREFALAPMAWLYVPDKEAEDFITARLGLTYEQKLQAERIIRISHNFAKLKRLLQPHQLPLDDARVNKLCEAISGY